MNVKELISKIFIIDRYEKIKSNYLFDFFILFVGRILFQLFLFLNWKLLIDYLSVEDFGYYSLINKTQLILTPIVSLGIANALSIYIPSLITKNKKIDKYVKQSIKYQFISFLLFVITGTIIYIASLSFNLIIIFNEYFFVIIFGVIIMVATNFIYLYYISFKKIFIAAFLYSMQGLISFIILIFLINQNKTLYEILWGLNIGLLIPYIPILIILPLNMNYNKKFNLKIEPQRSINKEVFKNFNIYFIIFNFSYFILNNIEPFFLNNFLNIVTSATFSYYLVFISIESLGNMAVILILTPIFSEIYTKQTYIDKSRYTQYFKIGLKFSFGIFLSILLLILNIISIIPELIQFQKFNANLIEFYIINIYNFFYLFAMTNMVLNTSRGKIKINAYIIFSTSIFLILLNFIFTPKFGISALISIKILAAFFLFAFSLYTIKDYLNIIDILKSIIPDIIIFLSQFSICFFQLQKNIILLVIIDVIFFFYLIMNKNIKEFIKSINFKKKNNK